MGWRIVTVMGMRMGVEMGRGPRGVRCERVGCAWRHRGR